MSIDNIQELLKPRYKVIADYPEIERHNIRIGDVITRSESAMYADKTQDGTPVVAIDHEIFPAVFRRLEWWEERSPEDMPEYVKHGENGKPRKIAEFYPIYGEVVFEGGRRRKLNSKWIPATKLEYDDYLNQTNHEQRTGN